jgi:hypothetical protein
VELVGTQMTVLLVQKVKAAMRREFRELRYFTDSTTILLQYVRLESSHSRLEYRFDRPYPDPLFYLTGLW